MRRREFIAVVAGALSWPVAADAQQTGKMPRIGILNNGFAGSTTNSALFQGLRELGYTEGQNLAIEFRFADWQLDRHPALGDELVESLGSPGGNVTGNTFLGPELVAKRLQLLRDAVPGFSRLAAIWHPGAYGERTMRGFLNETEATARKLGIELQLVQALYAADLENAFSAMIRWNADALIVLPSPMLFAEHRRIVELAAKARRPAMYQAREFVDV